MKIDSTHSNLKNRLANFQLARRLSTPTVYFSGAKTVDTFETSCSPLILTVLQDAQNKERDNYLKSLYCNLITFFKNASLNLSIHSLTETFQIDQVPYRRLKVNKHEIDGPELDLLESTLKKSVHPLSEKSVLPGTIRDYLVRHSSNDKDLPPSHRARRTLWAVKLHESGLIDQTPAELLISFKSIKAKNGQYFMADKIIPLHVLNIIKAALSEAGSDSDHQLPEPPPKGQNPGGKKNTFRKKASSGGGERRAKLAEAFAKYRREGYE